MDSLVSTATQARTPHKPDRFNVYIGVAPVRIPVSHPLNLVSDVYESRAWSGHMLLTMLFRIAGVALAKLSAIQCTLMTLGSERFLDDYC